MIGLYAIVNKVNNKMYIGSSANLKLRLRLHKSAIKTGKFYQKQSYSEDAIKYGFDAFEFKVLCITDTYDFARELETKYLTKFIGDGLYNKAPHANGASGIKRNPENYRVGAAKRISNPEYANKLSIACKGKRKIVKCPHCGKEGGGGNMRRYHFDKCNKNES